MEKNARRGNFNKPVKYGYFATLLKFNQKLISRGGGQMYLLEPDDKPEDYKGNLIRFT